MKIKTNKKELKELDACESGYKTFVKAHGDNDALLSQYLESNGWDDVWWLISESHSQFSDEQKRDLKMFGCNRALLNIEKIKPYCSNDDYELILKYLNSGDEALRSAARTAAESTWKAIRSSLSAWEAARSAVMSTESVGSVRSEWAVEAAVYSSARSTAAESAAWEAARLAVIKESTQILMDLFLKWEQS